MKRARNGNRVQKHNPNEAEIQMAAQAHPSPKLFYAGKLPAKNWSVYRRGLRRHLFFLVEA